ncbi:MAG: ABC transporter substrate-binding protein [Dehalococcoidia bacterium]|nr:MAG: ABC transporter substrate-binding protein [Dehalococcoidia bacterium]
MTLADAWGRLLTIRQRPERIVSLVPSLTEALFAFGLDEEIVGVTRFCVEPRQGVAGKTKVGGTKALDVAKIKSLRPDLVVASAEENSPGDVTQLIDYGFPVFVTLVTNIESAIDLLRHLAAITGTTAAARPIIQGAKEALAFVQGAGGGREKVRVFCPIWRNPYMTCGRGTYMHDVITVCGGRNVFGERQESYPRLELAEMAALDPQVILLPNEPYRFTKRHKADFKAFAEVTAVKNGHIFLVDGKVLTWYGPRIAESLSEVKRLLGIARSPGESSERLSS